MQKLFTETERDRLHEMGQQYRIAGKIKHYADGQKDYVYIRDLVDLDPVAASMGKAAFEVYEKAVKKLKIDSGVKADMLKGMHGSLRAHARRLLDREKNARAYWGKGSEPY